MGLVGAGAGGGINVITVQPIRMELFMEQVLFKCCRDGRLFFFFQGS